MLSHLIRSRTLWLAILRSEKSQPGRLNTSARALFTSQIQRTDSPGITPIEDFLDLKFEQKENETYVEAVPIDTGREGRVIQVPSSKEACALCRLNLKNLNYTDVMILSQFVKRDGSLATYHESKLCPKQYRNIIRLIKQAQRCNLISRPANYLVPGPWHDLNTYLERDRRRDQPMKIVKKEYWKM